MKYISNSPSQTTAIARNIAKQYQNRGGIITLQGPLGAGKTTFIQSFAKALGISNRITSPTFIISKQYPIPNSQFTLYHLDLYRLESSIDIRSLSLDELIQNPNNLILIEWPEKISNLDQLERLSIRITPGDTSRQFSISYDNPHTNRQPQ